MTGRTEKLTALSHAGHTTWSEIENVKFKQSKYEEQLMKLTGQMSEMLVRMKGIQTQTVYGNTGSSQTNGSVTNKNIMEYRRIPAMEKLSDDAKSFSVWSLHLKNTLKQINPIYTTLLELIERLPNAVVTYEGWCAN